MWVRSFLINSSHILEKIFGPIHFKVLLNTVIMCFSREGVCPLCYGFEPLWSASFGVSDDLPGSAVSRGHHCCASEPRHWTQLRILGTAQRAGAESPRTVQTHVISPVTCCVWIHILSHNNLIWQIQMSPVCCTRKAQVLRLIAYLCPSSNKI